MPEGVRLHPVAKKLGLQGEYYDKAIGKSVAYNIDRVYEGFGVMYGAGVVSGLLGIGSGSFKVMAMDVFMKMPLKVSTATSNFMMGVTAAASAGIYLLRGDIIPTISAPVGAGRSRRGHRRVADHAAAEKQNDPQAVYSGHDLYRLPNDLPRMEGLT
ncbi:hypothetical protein HMSSN036_83360 [Paenibacillus macerans]|nr:hypothetical protein HMSSN036_83360 [Paenibacillus macerans]